MNMTRTTFNRLRDVKDSLPHGSMAVIAEELGLANETVKWYRKRMLAKFQVASSLEMVVKAMEMQIL